MKQHKPGDLFKSFQAKKMKRRKSDMAPVVVPKMKKKSYSDASMGSMKGYDPNNGIGKVGMAKLGYGKIAKHKKHKKNWIAKAIGKPGALHAELGIKQGNKIPAKTLAKAAKKGGKEGKRARLAEILKSFHHKHKKSMHCKTCSC